jgi:bacterioferritin
MIQILTEQSDLLRVSATLNRLLESELAGVVHYTHYALMVYGHNRIPIVKWLRDQATESLGHANRVGEMITALGEHPSLAIGELLDNHNHEIQGILKDSLEHEHEGLALYKQLLGLVEGKSVFLEEFAREMIYAEEMHVSEVVKMMRKPGATTAPSA